MGEPVARFAMVSSAAGTHGIELVAVPGAVDRAASEAQADGTAD